LRTPKEKRSRGGSFFVYPGVFLTLDPSVKRYAQTKRLLARRSLSALKRLRDFSGASFLPRE
jgi:hypothetical protein